MLATSLPARAQTIASGGSSPGDGDAHIVPFQQPSYLAPFDASHEYFEAGIFPHFDIWSNVTNRLTLGRHDYWLVSITPGVRLRMLHAFSEPVRSPSYMPRLEVQQIFDVKAVGGRPLEPGRAVDLWAWGAALEHHSNGQAACPFTTETPNLGNDTCTQPPGVPNVLSALDTTDGSFSTNEFRGGLDFRREWLGAGDQAVRRLSASVEYQRQVWTDPDIAPFYSHHRINAYVDVGWRGYRWMNRTLLRLALTTALDRPVPSVDRLSISPEAVWFPWGRSDLGFFVRFYRGQDYYNMAFATNATRLQIGIEFDQDGFFAFKKSPR